MESAEGYLVIKNLGSGKYFGTDDNVAWSHVYSDKPGAGARSNYFELIDPLRVNYVAVDESCTDQAAVYNLQGIRVADTPDEIHAKGIYIVVSGRHIKKIIK